MGKHDEIPPPPRMSCTPPDVKISALRWTGLQHIAGIAGICWLAHLHRDIEWYYWVGSILAILGIVQLPAALGKGPAGTWSALALLAPGLKAVAHKWHVLSIVLLSACTVLPPIVDTPPPVCESPQHAWGDGERVYHLPHDSLSPVVVNISSYSLDLGAWNRLRTPLQLRAEGDGFVIEVRDGGDASSNWLGLASVTVDSDGHLGSGMVQMNRTLLSRYPEVVARHVMCQELGHVLGLDHQHADDSCMDDCSGRGAGWLPCLSTEQGATPNAHDAEELREIYAHATGAQPPARCMGSVTVDVFPGREDMP